MLQPSYETPESKTGCVMPSRSTGPGRDRPPRGIVSKIPSVVLAITLALVPGMALARGGGGHGGGGHGGGGHSGSGGHATVHSGGGAHAGAYVGGVHAGSVVRHGGRYGGHLWLGPGYVWAQRAHWGSGFWSWGAGSWLWYAAPWWVTPDYPGWVWMGQPPVSDDQPGMSPDGYWTTADMDDGSSQVSPWEAPPPVVPPPPEEE